MSGQCPTPDDCRRGEPCLIATGCDNDPRIHGAEAHRAAILQAVNAAAQAIYESVPGVMASDWTECIGSAEKVVVAVYPSIARAVRASALVAGSS